jgi:hypothetical protein
LSVTVSPGVATHLGISGPGAATAGVTFTITLSALDAFGNIATGYRGKVHFTSSDHNATLPADYTFTAADNGSHTFTATLKAGGKQTITVTDSANGFSATGQTTAQ